MILLLRYWREAGIALLVVVLFGMWRSRENALVERGKAQERVRVADSTLAVLRPLLARVDTQIVQRTTTVTRTIARVDSLRDTVLLHLTDTVIVRQFVERTDSALAACRDLAGSCALFRTTATATIAALEAKVKAVPIAMPRSCVPTGAVSGLVGLGLGFLGARVSR